MIFETERLLVRKLVMEGLFPFHKMQSNPKVMQYADGEVKSLKAHQLELKELISKYNLTNNNFWIYAVEHKFTSNFVGTVALVKDGKEDEIGYRFLEQFWGRGYGFEICKGLIMYCRAIKIPKIIGYVVDKNVASVNILEKLNFTMVKKFMNDDMGLLETKYELKL